MRSLAAVRGSLFRKRTLTPRQRRRRTRRRVALAVLAVVYLFLPDVRFEAPLSTVVLDRHDQLLGARIAADGQWRFPAPDSVPHKFATALIAFEDKRFRYHPGVDPIALARAAWQNLTNFSVVSGGSTLSMQVIRLSRPGRSRSLWNKLVELVFATRLELRYSKAEILRLYAANAPFGGNVVGLRAASWKYFGREPHQLSWAEAATLAVLPNSPGLITPGRNRAALKRKRDALLVRLHANGTLDAATAQLAQAEALPARPLPLPNRAPHLTDRVHSEQRARETALFRSTVDAELQARVQQAVARYSRWLAENEIHNAAAVVLEVPTGEVRAYVGNSAWRPGPHGYHVDIIPAPRSSGSIFKPFLYACLLDEGQLLPEAYVPDVPTNFAGYRPKNFSRQYQGAVSVKTALARSLNVPFARLLAGYGQPKFYQRLKDFGLSTLHQPSAHYGLSLILGGAEASLWDLARMYHGLARTLWVYEKSGGKYTPAAFGAPVLDRTAPPDPTAGNLQPTGPLSAGAAWFTLEALRGVVRPYDEAYWRSFASSRSIAWKTGTSFGFRDAWAVGVSPRWVVAVWVGNADGEGRPGLVGTQAAAPILFDIFDGLPASTAWFEKPTADLARVRVCVPSGYRASRHSPANRWAEVPRAGRRSPPCPYSQPVHLDATGTYRVHGDCASPGTFRTENRFVLPPHQAAYYSAFHPEYEAPPPWREDCAPTAPRSNAPALQVVVPRAGKRIILPRDLDGNPGAVVFQAAHQDPAAQLFWHLNGAYLGTTLAPHNLEARPPTGTHTLVVLDAAGRRVERRFTVSAR